VSWVIVPAAGRGLRFDALSPKQYWSVAGRTILEHTLERLLAHPAIEAVIVALAADDARFAHLPVASDPRVQRVIGGAERADSVRAGLAALPVAVEPEHAVLVHDAARPCLRPELLDRLLACADEPAGALLALPVVDTLKRSDGQSQARVVETVERQYYWRAQTPQLFPRGLLQRALDAAAREGRQVTDEAMAVEALALAPRLVEGSEDNRKLTRPEDLALIAAWLEANPLTESQKGGKRQ
jgi:2-C-methyl-D-erythritol 4-phosphate cytidylyltransferase